MKFQHTLLALTLAFFTACGGGGGSSTTDLNATNLNIEGVYSSNGAKISESATDISANDLKFVEIRFSGELADLNESFFSIKGDESNVGFNITKDKKVVQIKLDDGFKRGVKYTLETLKDIKSKKDTVVQKGFKFTFTTKPIDLSITGVYSSKGTKISKDATDISVDDLKFVEIRFSGELADLNESFFSIKGGGSDVDFSINKNTQTSVRIKLDDGFKHGVQYTLETLKDIKSKKGTAVQKGFSLTFTTKPKSEFKPLSFLYGNDESNSSKKQYFLGIKENITIVFNKPIDKSSIKEGVLLYANGEQDLNYTLQNGDKTLVIKPTDGLWADQIGDIWEIHLTKKLKNTSGENLDDENETIFNAGDTTLDLNVSSTSISDGDTDIPTTISYITARFNQKIFTKDIKNYISLHEDGNAAKIEFDLQTGYVEYKSSYWKNKRPLDYVISVTPKSPLKANTKHILTIKKGIKAASTKLLKADKVISFTTGVKDETPPKIKKIGYGESSAIKEGTEVDPYSSVWIEFTEKIKQDATKFILLNTDDNEKVEVSEFYETDVGFKPLAGKYGVNYTLTIKKGIQDLSGNELQEDNITNFQTKPKPSVIKMLAHPGSGTKAMNVCKNVFMLSYDNLVAIKDINKIKVQEKGTSTWIGVTSAYEDKLKMFGYKLLMIKTSTDLDESKKYTIKIESGAVQSKIDTTIPVTPETLNDIEADGQSQDCSGMFN